MKDDKLLNRTRYGKSFETGGDPVAGGMKNNRLITWPVAGFLIGFSTRFSDRTINTFWDLLLGSMTIATAWAMIFMVAALTATYVFKKPVSVFTDANYLAFLFPAAVILLKLFGGDFAGFAILPAVLFVWLLHHAEPVQ